MSDVRPGLVRRLNDRLLDIGAHPGETADQRGRRRIMVGALGYSLPFTVAGAFSFAGSWVLVADVAKPLAHLVGLILVARHPTRFHAVLRVLFAVDIASDVATTVLLGGLYRSGFQVGWSLIIVLGVLVAFSVREAVVWFGLFVVEVLVAAASASIGDPVYEPRGDPERDAAFTMVGVMILVFLVMAHFVRQRDRYQQQSDGLLRNILPDEVAERLKERAGMIAEQFDEATVLFADVAGFTPMSAGMSPVDLVGLLDEVFTDIDVLVDEMGLEKIKTVGDEYMVAAGVPRRRPDHAHAAAELALRIQALVASKDYSGQRIAFRIGLHSGPVVAGIIGRRKFAYDLWGDVVNTASRMESHGEPGRIQISEATHRLVEGDFECASRGTVPVKGKGLLETWFLEGRRDTASPARSARRE